MEGEFANFRKTVFEFLFRIGFKMSWDWKHFFIGILLRPEMKGMHKHGEKV